MLAVGILWSLFTVYAVMLILPFMDRRLREWDMRLKQSRVPLKAPNRPQRIVFILLTSLMTAVSFAAAAHRNLSEMLGVSSWTPVFLMIFSPLAYFALGVRGIRQP